MTWFDRTTEVIGERHRQSFAFWLGVLPPAITLFGLIVGGLQIADWLRYLVSHWQSGTHWIWSHLLWPFGITIPREAANAMTFCAFANIGAIRVGQEAPVRGLFSHIFEGIGVIILIIFVTWITVLITLFLLLIINVDALEFIEGTIASEAFIHLMVIGALSVSILGYGLLFRKERLVYTMAYTLGCVMLLSVYTRYMNINPFFYDDNTWYKEKNWIIIGHIVIVIGITLPFFIASLKNYFIYLLTVGVVVLALVGLSQLHHLRQYVENPPDKWPAERPRQ